MLARFLQLLVCADFRLNSLPCSGSTILQIVNWETLGKRACVMNVSGKCSLGFLDILLKLTGVTHQRSVPGSRVTLPDHFAYKRGLSLTILVRTLLACTQGLRKLQISFSVHLLTHVKRSDVIFHQTSSKTRHN